MPTVIVTKQDDGSEPYDGYSRKTTYAGVVFRSRLESLWARHFDDLGLTWHYEPVTLGYRYGSYTPDFALDQPRCYVEVKPDIAVPPRNNLDAASCIRPVIVVFGPPNGFLTRVHISCGWWVWPRESPLQDTLALIERWHEMNRLMHLGQLTKELSIEFWGFDPEEGA